MQHQIIAGVVFLALLSFSPLSFSLSENLKKEIKESVGEPCDGATVQLERDCRTKRIQAINNMINNKKEQLLIDRIKAESGLLIKQEDVVKTMARNQQIQEEIAELKDMLASERAELPELDKEKNFVGFNWGVGLAFTSRTGKKAVKDAKVIGGVVRITDDYSYSTGLMLETHYYFATRKTKDKQEIGIGPFVALRVADTESKNWEIGAYGIGLMLGGRRDGTVKGFNLGIGYFVDTKVKRLGDGIVEGQPLPSGETDVRLRNTDAYGWMAILTATF